MSEIPHGSRAMSLASRCPVKCAFRRDHRFERFILKLDTCCSMPAWSEVLLDFYATADLTLVVDPTLAFMIALTEFKWALR